MGADHRCHAGIGVAFAEELAAGGTNLALTGQAKDGLRIGTQADRNYQKSK